MYLSLHCHHQNDFCFKMGSDESLFNVSVESGWTLTIKTASTNHSLSEEKGELKRVTNRGPSAYQPNSLPLGQTGSQQFVCFADCYFNSYTEHSHKGSARKASVEEQLCCKTIHPALRVQLHLPALDLSWPLSATRQSTQL